MVRTDIISSFVTRFDKIIKFRRLLRIPFVATRALTDTEQEQMARDQKRCSAFTLMKKPSVIEEVPCHGCWTLTSVL